MEFLISYRGVTAEHRFLSDRFYAAAAMMPLKDPRTIGEFTLPIDPDQPLAPTQFLNHHQDAILEELMQQGILLTDAQQSTQAGTRTKTVITLPTIRIRLSVKEDLATIAVIE